MKNFLMSMAVVSTLALSLTGLAHAEQHGGYGATPLPKHQQECSSCHVAYPPGLLPAASWGRIMGNLNKHFGTDASLDEASTREIAAWLKSNAGSGRRGGEEPAQDRISKANWFVRQHDEVSASTWKRASIGSAANCSACHAGAAKGDFNEHAVRIPK
jgi:nitrate/TMAO reductase-like tetraheme cytochrome c subunit